MIITDVAPVSATACVMGIDGFLGCTLDAHICCVCSINCQLQLFYRRRLR